MDEDNVEGVAGPSLWLPAQEPFENTLGEYIGPKYSPPLVSKFENCVVWRCDKSGIWSKGRQHVLNTKLIQNKLGMFAAAELLLEKVAFSVREENPKMLQGLQWYDAGQPGHIMLDEVSFSGYQAPTVATGGVGRDQNAETTWFIQDSQALMSWQNVLHNADTNGAAMYWQLKHTRNRGDTRRNMALHDMDGTFLASFSKGGSNLPDGGWIMLQKFFTFESDKWSYPDAPACVYDEPSNVHVCPHALMSPVTVAVGGIKPNKFQIAADGHVFPDLPFPGGAYGGKDVRALNMYNLANGARTDHSMRSTDTADIFHNVNLVRTNAWSRQGYFVRLETDGHLFRIPTELGFFLKYSNPGDWGVFIFNAPSEPTVRAHTHTHTHSAHKHTNTYTYRFKSGEGLHAEPTHLLTSLPPRPATRLTSTTRPTTGCTYSPALVRRATFLATPCSGGTRATKRWTKQTAW